MVGCIRPRPRVWSVQGKRQTRGATVADMTAQDLAEHLEVLEQANEEERDRLLHELLIAVYATREAQDC